MTVEMPRFRQRRVAVPICSYEPGLGSGNLVEEQVAELDQILAEEMACSAFPEIDPMGGVVPTVYPAGLLRRPWGQIKLEVFYQPDRIENGQARADAIADRASLVFGYTVAVWMNVGGTFFYSRSDARKQLGAP